MVSLNLLMTNQNNSGQYGRYMAFGLKIVSDFGATIAVPVVAFVFLAQAAERRYGIGGWLTIVAFAIAAIITAKLIVTKAKRYGKEYNDIDKVE